MRLNRRRCCVAAAAPPTLAVRMKAELPPAGMETTEVQDTSVVLLRTQVQFAPLGPAGLKGVASAPDTVMVLVKASRKLMVPLR